VLFPKPDTLPTVEELVHTQHSSVSSCDMPALSIDLDSNRVKSCDSLLPQTSRRRRC
jgi:hypothetical protein